MFGLRCDIKEKYFTLYFFITASSRNSCPEARRSIFCSRMRSLGTKGRKGTNFFTPEQHEVNFEHDTGLLALLGLITSGGRVRYSKYVVTAIARENNTGAVSLR